MQIAPESRHRHNQPYVQDVAVRGKSEYEQEHSRKHIRKTGRPDVEKTAAYEHCETREKR